MSEAVATNAPRVFSGKLHRTRRGRAQTFVAAPPPPRPPVRRPARVAVMLALAHKIEDSIQRGAVHDRADVARRLGLTRARVTQLLNLTLLAPDIQETLLELESVDGVEPACGHGIRIVGHARAWDEQRRRWAPLACIHPEPTPRISTRPPGWQATRPSP